MFTRLILGLLAMINMVYASFSFAEENAKFLPRSQANIYISGQFFLSESERNAWDAYAISLKQQSEKQLAQKKALLTDTLVSTPLKR